MNDHWNPTKKDIQEWAYSNQSVPDQDWELAVYDYENMDMILEFVDDIYCPKRLFFLGCLYVFTGDIIRKNSEIELKNLQSVIRSATKYSNVLIKDWIERSNALISHPENYSYEFWGLNSKYISDEK